ncbi:MAG TPA: sulfite oxidase, partial [Rubrobacteraceae bacterium]|nr:sulfite oxidase [Rubrobacteraceae bacterium]
YEDILKLPSVTVARMLECAGNGRIFFEERQGREAPGTPWRLGAVGVAEWTGVPLREVLLRAGLKKSAREVMPESLDAVRMRRPLPIEKALEEDVILAYAMNGEPLPADHGFPVRVIVPRWAAVASVKWVGRIHVAEERLFSPWNTDKYVMTGGSFGTVREPVTAQVVKSALELPWPASLPEKRCRISGRSWSMHGAISRVQYSIDGGPWREARLIGPNIPGAWARWYFYWNAKPGRHEIRARATDEAGYTQPEETTWNDLGYLYGGIVGHPINVY